MYFIINLLIDFSIQQVATGVNDLNPAHRSNLHGITVSLLALLGRSTGVNNVMEYTLKIVEAREEEAPYMLPPLMDSDAHHENLNLDYPHLLIDKLALSECLQTAGMEFNRVQTGNPYSKNQTDHYQHRQSWVDPGLLNKGSNPDLNLNNNDIDSVTSSPGVQRVINFFLNFKYFIINYDFFFV